MTTTVNVKVGGKTRVVIDPEDREQVERLTGLFYNERTRGDRDTIVGGSTDAMQAALRSLVAPPRPPEPLGLGAVVEDDEGVLFVRTCVGGWEWHEAGGGPTSWNMITAVRVLSEGVTE